LRRARFGSATVWAVVFTPLRREDFRDRYLEAGQHVAAGQFVRDCQAPWKKPLIGGVAICSARTKPRPAREPY